MISSGLVVLQMCQLRPFAMGMQTARQKMSRTVRTMWEARSQAERLQKPTELLSAWKRSIVTQIISQGLGRVSRTGNGQGHEDFVV